MFFSSYRLIFFKFDAIYIIAIQEIFTILSVINLNSSGKKMSEQLLFGQYRIESTIGAGGMAVVYKAFHISLDKYFAIKKLSDSLAQSGEAKERFIREARTHSRLDHPNIVKFHDILQDHATGNVYIVMEYVEGRTLAKMIGKETGPIPFEKAWPIFKQMLEGIGYAHSQGVVHRDIKPGNIIVTPENKVKILDFGIARDETGHTITQSGQVVGTLQYASPEQIKGERVDQRSDIYNLGMTLYEMVAGRLPHDINPNSSSFHIMQRMLNDDVPDPRQFYPHIPENVVAAIFKAIERDVNKRVGSINEFEDLLDPKSASNYSGGIALFEPPKAARIGDPVTEKFTIDHVSHKVASKPVKIENEYEELKQLSKKYDQFIVRQQDDAICLINSQDGKRIVRILLMILNIVLGFFLFIMFFSALSLKNKDALGPLIIFITIFGGLLWVSILSYRKRRFSEETLFIEPETLKLTKQNDLKPRFIRYDEIENVNERSDHRCMMIKTKNKYHDGHIVFQNSKHELLVHLAPIINDIVKKKQKQLQGAS